MLLGKRARPAVMRRTTSMSGMSLDMQSSNTEPQEASDPNASMAMPHPQPQPQPQSFMVSPRNTSTMDSTPHFLRTCGLCNRRLAPGRDIYMYRGDTAFCSLECREEQMKQDERKDKWKVVSTKEDPRASPPTSTSKASTKSETVAAA